MRKTMILAACSMLVLAPVAYAQTQPAPPPVTPETAQEQQAAPAPTIKKVEVVDLMELSPESQEQVNAVTAKATESELQSLRQSIDANPQVTTALQAEGVTSANVIAVAMASDGTLTVITKKSG